MLSGKHRIYECMEQQNETDQQLINRVLRDGRRADYAKLVDRYGARLFAFVATMVPCREDAEELSQDCFVKAYRQLSQYDAQRSSFYTWLRSIAYRLCLDHVRRLPPTERLLVQQHYFEQQPLAVIAEVTDTDAGTLATRLHRIRKKLCQYIKLKEYGN